MKTDIVYKTLPSKSGTMLEKKTLTTHSPLNSRTPDQISKRNVLKIAQLGTYQKDAMESFGLELPWSSTHSFHALPLGKFVSAFFCRLTLLRRLIVEKSWMNWHIAYLFVSTASFWFFSSSIAWLRIWRRIKKINPLHHHPSVKTTISSVLDCLIIKHKHIQPEA